MAPNIEAEITQLHQFFQDWFNGRLSPTDASFSRLEDVLDPDFLLIAPNGVCLKRDRLAETLRSAHNSNEGLQIWIENMAVHQQIGDIFIATYQEWQELEERVTSRLSTAVFQSFPGTPNGIKWIHVHETWIQP